MDKTSRRSFLLKSAALAGALTYSGLLINKWVRSGSLANKAIPGKIVGPSASVGHMLREKMFQSPSEVMHYPYVIVGGGISGLSAAKTLIKNRVESFCLLELEPNVGGNASSGSNNTTAYPWGAHYLPIPNAEHQELMSYLEEIDVITGYTAEGVPFYNDYYLCFDPKERLFIHGHWQDGLIPHYGVPEEDQKQLKDFLDLMNEYRYAKGKDGKYAFDLPVDSSSQDEQYLALDNLTIYNFLLSKGFTSPYLHWYVEYCCKDDYGTNIQTTSAWAGIHYFAARRGVAANAENNTVLTWPQGNGWLVSKLREGLESNILSSSLAYNIIASDKGVQIDFLDIKSGTNKRIIADKCIMATPQFVNQRITKGIPDRDKAFYDKFTYSPWMVANLTVKDLKEKNGSPLSWDNVMYGSKSLGYVHANHQHLSRTSDKRVITYYWPLTDDDPKAIRQEAINKTHAEWTSQILEDLFKVYPDLKQQVENIDICVWGHGMPRPVPGFIWSESRKKASISVENKLFFAHSDLSGLSLFEEAFYHGTKAAKQALMS